jgi:phosphoserine phosphatase RsbU/P
VNPPWEQGVRDPARLDALQRSGLAGTGPEDAFDRLIELAAELTGVHRGVITLVDAERTVAKSILGFPEGSPSFAPIEQSFCRFVVGSGRPLIVNDARQDPRTRGDPAIAAYDAATWAGYPIEDADGMVLGTFCLMDSRPHEWSPQDLHILATLAKAASSEIALRRARAEATARREEIEALRAGIERSRLDLVAHLHALLALDPSAAAVGRDLLAWLGVPDGPAAQA